MHTARVLSDDILDLGEGPTWDASRGVAHWVDITTGSLFEGVLDGDTITTKLLHRVDGTLGAAVHAVGGGYLLAITTSLQRIDDQGATIGELGIIPDGMTSRLNDGAVDPDGRYLVGSMDFDQESGGQLLVRVEHSGEITVIDDDLVISNGLGWSPDGGTLYSIDSIPGAVWVRDYDPGSTAIGRRHLLIDDIDTPDGMTVDSDGNLWIALWGSSEVRCYSPAGRLLDVVTTTAPFTSAAAFVGPELSTLLITSASRGTHHEHPDAGKLFAVELEVRGPATTAWRPSF